MSFLENISDFYHWMAQFDEVNARSRTNYISWLKFLSNNYDIDEHITENAIKGIIDSKSIAVKFCETEDCIIGTASCCGEKAY